MIKSVQKTSYPASNNIELEISNLEQEFEQELQMLKGNFLKAPKDAVAYALKKISESTKEGSSLSEC